MLSILEGQLHEAAGCWPVGPGRDDVFAQRGDRELKPLFVQRRVTEEPKR